MSYAILEKEIKTLPEVLQKNIEDYVISVIDSYKKAEEKSRWSNLTYIHLTNHLQFSMAWMFRGIFPT